MGPSVYVHGHHHSPARAAIVQAAQKTGRRGQLCRTMKGIRQDSIKERGLSISVIDAVLLLPLLRSCCLLFNAGVEPLLTNDPASRRAYGGLKST